MTIGRDSPPPGVGARPGVAGWLAAVIGPLVVLGIPVAYWARPEVDAGPTERQRSIAARMVQPPEVVVLGASKVGTDLDRGVLARGVGTTPERLALLQISGSTAATWYAILDNLVFGRGHSPRLVMVYSTFDWALATEPIGEVARKTLRDLVEPGDDVVWRKALGASTGDSTLERVRRRRTGANRALFAGVRDLAVGSILAAPGPDGVLAAGRTLAEPALDALFGAEAGLDASSAGHAIPIVEAARAVTRGEVDPATSFLPDFADLAEAHGTKLVFIDAPVKRGAQAQFRVAPEVMARAVALLGERGVGFIDLAHPGMPDSAFGDAAHLNRNGRSVLTAALVDRLGEIGALADGPMTPAVLPLASRPPRGTRIGSTSALAVTAVRRGAGACGWEAILPAVREISDSYLRAAGIGAVSPLVFTEDGTPLRPHANREDFADRCSGAFQHQDRLVKFSPSGDDPAAGGVRVYEAALSPGVPLVDPRGTEAWWVYPGTELRLDLQGREGGTAGGRVTIDALALGPGTGTPTAAAKGGDAVSFTGGTVRRAEVEASEGTLVVASPADGPYLLVARMVVGSGADALAAIGSLGRQSTGVLGGRDRFAGVPPELGPLPGPTVHGPATLRFDLSSTGVPDTREVRGAASISGCSPARAAAPGEPVGALVAREQDLDRGAGTLAQVGTDLLLRVAGSAAAADAGSYRVFLDPARKCQSMRWLYPGDRLQVEVTPLRAATLLGPVDRVELGGVTFPSNGEVSTAALGRLEISAGSSTLLDATFDLRDLAAAPPSWTLDPPIAPGMPLTLAVSTAATAPFTLLTSIEISADGLPPGGGAR